MFREGDGGCIIEVVRNEELDQEKAVKKEREKKADKMGEKLSHCWFRWRTRKLGECV